jgi:uncharacterized membrane-anchored protein YhcB (DUF1043 family)
VDAVEYAPGKTIATTRATSLNGRITVAIDHLREWASVKGNDPNDLRLYLGGRMLPDSKPLLTNPQQEYINFELKMASTSRALWTAILTEAREQRTKAKDNGCAADHPEKCRILPLSVGKKDDTGPVESDVWIDFQVFPEYWWAVVLGLCVLVGGILLLGWKSDLLRADVTQPLEGGAKAPFSLARVQMAWWLCLVVGSFLYIWMITQEVNTPTASVLALIGISAATGFSALVMDKTKTGKADAERRALESDQAALDQRVTELAASHHAETSVLFKELQEKRSELHKVNADIAQLPPVPKPAKSRMFWRDLVSDGEGISFPRFQMVVWTIVLAVVFVQKVHSQLAMPEFDTTLLGLMGISSGTYVTFKNFEKAK